MSSSLEVSSLLKISFFQHRFFSQIFFFSIPESVPLDIITNFVRVSKSPSSINVETVDLEDVSSDASEQWSVDDDSRTTAHGQNAPIPVDIEPNWSAVPLVQFSREVYDAEPPSQQSQRKIEVVSVVDFRKSSSNTALPYRNLVLAVVADLHQVEMTLTISFSSLKQIVNLNQI